MASKETSVMAELRDLTECSICNSMISDPRGLPCIHTFCLECLENFESSSHKKPDDKMLCPVCRKEFTIPPEGMKGLQKNFFVERLAELMKISKPIGNVTGCDACQVNNDSNETETEASEYCIQCREKLCSRCSTEHLRHKFTRRHQVVQIGCDVSEMLAEKHYPSACDLHPGENTKMFCVECKVVICMMCFAESHNTHKCMDVRKAGEKFQEEIENDIKKLTDFVKETMDRKEELEQERKKLLEELRDTERMIKCKCKGLRDVVDKYANDLLDELNSVEQKRFKVMDSRKEEVERHLDSIERFNSYSKEIICRGSPSDICRAVNDLQMRAVELQTMHEIHIRQRSPPVNVSFKEAELEGLLHVNNVIGKVEETEETEKIVKTSKEKIERLSILRPAVAIRTGIFVCMVSMIVALWYNPNKNVSVSPMMHLNVSCDKVLSIAFSQTRINVLCGNRQRILIYEDQAPFNLETSLSLDFVPKTMVASPSSDHLYVSDSEDYCIYMLSRQGSRYVTTEWMCDDDDLTIQSLSGDGSTILVTDGYSFRLKLYNTEYTILLQSFELPTDSYSEATDPYIEEFCYPHKSAVKTSTGDFIVSCGCHDEFICKLNKAGSIVQRSKMTGTSEELTHPIHMCLNSNDQVIVADTLNNRILLLNSDLTWNRVLLSGSNDGGVIRPVLLSYKTNLKLLVVVNFKGDIAVYNADAIGL